MLTSLALDKKYDMMISSSLAAPGVVAHRLQLHIVILVQQTILAKTTFSLPSSLLQRRKNRGWDGKNEEHNEENSGHFVVV